MKKFVKILSLCLTLILTFSLFACDSCGDNGGSGNGGSGKEEGKNVLLPSGTYNDFALKKDKVEGTVHERNIVKSESYIVADGETDYKLLIPQDAGTNVKLAATEFNAFFSEATGKKLPLVTDAGLTYSNDDKYISLGKTTLFTASGISVDYEEIGPQGYLLKTVDNSVYVVGEDKGVLWGTYDLLNVLVNFEEITSNYYTLDKNVKNLSLFSFDVKEIPDFEYRLTSYGSVYKNATAANRMRLIRDGDTYIVGCQSHSAFRMVPVSTYFADHPKWYSNVGGETPAQLCYTAHGDKEEYNGLVKVQVDYIIGKLQNDFEHNLVSMMQEDINVWCSCESCTALKNKYGTNAASSIMFVNDVAEQVEKWINENQPGRKVKFNMGVYHQTESAPTVRNADGTFSAIDDKVILRDNVAINVAPIAHDFVNSVYDPENENLKNLYLSWTPISKNVATWLYDVYFGDLLVPFNSWGSIPDNFRFLKSIGAFMIFPEAASTQTQNTNFDNLKTYYYAKLMWNVNEDVNELIHHYFTALYKDVAPVMEQAFWQMRAEQYKQKLLGLDGSVWSGALTTTYFTKRYLEGQIETFNSALESAKKYETEDPAYYSKLVDEIKLESIGSRYMFIKLYDGTMSESEYEKFVKEFGEDAIRLQVDVITGESYMSDFVSNL